MRVHNSPLSMPEVHPFHRLCYPWKPGIRGPSHLPEPQCAHVESGVVGGGVRLGGGSDSCFLPLLTQPREVTESGEDLRVSAWAEYLGPCERPESGVGEGSKGRYLRGAGIPEGARLGRSWPAGEATAWVT